MVMAVLTQSLLIILFGINLGTGMETYQEPPIVVEKENVILSCELHIDTGGVISWLFPNTTIAMSQCFAVDSFPYINGSCEYTDTLQIHKLQVNGVEVERDDGNYSCISGQDTSYLYLDVHVESTILTSSHDELPVTEGKLTNATCTTSCGYPSHILWYKVKDNDEEALTGGRETMHPGCDSRAKLRNVTSELQFEGEMMDYLRCCVENVEDDQPQCKDIKVVYEVPATTEASGAYKRPDLVTYSVVVLIHIMLFSMNCKFM